MSETKLPIHLLQSIAKRKCVLFVGAGVSYEAGVPTSSQLTKRLAIETGYPETYPQDLLEVCQYYQEKNGRNELINRLYAEIAKINVPSDSHLYIASLSHLFKSIITTNYDSLLEETFRKLNRNCYIANNVSTLANAPVESNISIILKMHGDLKRPESIVITKDDYYHYLNESLQSVWGIYLKSLLATGTILYVGYSLRDYNFVALYESLRKELGDFMHIGYAAMPSPDPVEVSFWSKKGINLINATAKELFREISDAVSPKPSYTVFISYNASDRKQAKKIKTELEKRGLNTFWAERDIAPGEDISEEISKGIIKSQIVLFLMTPNSVSSQWSLAELNQALTLKRGKIIPLLLNNCKIPNSIDKIKYIDMRTDFSSALDNLANNLAKEKNIQVSE